MRSSRSGCGRSRRPRVKAKSDQIASTIAVTDPSVGPCYRTHRLQHVNSRSDEATGRLSGENRNARFVQATERHSARSRRRITVTTKFIVMTGRARASAFIVLSPCPPVVLRMLRAKILLLPDQLSALSSKRLDPSWAHREPTPEETELSQIHTSAWAVRSPPASPVFITPRGSINNIRTSFAA